MQLIFKLYCTSAKWEYYICDIGQYIIGICSMHFFLLVSVLNRKNSFLACIFIVTYNTSVSQTVRQKYFEFLGEHVAV